MKKNFLKIINLIFIIAVVAGVFTVNAYAKENNGLDINLKYKFRDTEFKLYKVAKRDKNGDYIKVGRFRDVPVDFSDFKNENMADIANTLGVYAEKDGIDPLREEKTWENNTADFRSIDEGVYLITGESRLYKGYRYTPSPVVLDLTAGEGNDIFGGGYVKSGSIKIEMKYEKEKIYGNTEISVCKVWDDNGYNMRPSSVKVVLLKNGKSMDAVTLSDDNNWRAKWSDLSSDSVYDVVEKDVADGYSVIIEKEGSSFKVINRKGKRIRKNPQRDENNRDENNSVRRRDIKRKPQQDNVKQENSKHGIKRIPQTGQLWWPVPLLFLSAAFFIRKGI